MEPTTNDTHNRLIVSVGEEVVYSSPRLVANGNSNNVEENEQRCVIDAHTSSFMCECGERCVILQVSSHRSPYTHILGQCWRSTA